MIPAGATPAGHGPADQSCSPSRTAGTELSSSEGAVASTVFCSQASTGGSFHSGDERTAYSCDSSSSRYDGVSLRFRVRWLLIGKPGQKRTRTGPRPAPVDDRAISVARSHRALRTAAG